MAEGVGFEPTVGFPTLDFESSALNRTQPPFLEEKRKNRTSNVQHPTLNATAVEIGRSALGVGRLYSGNPIGAPLVARLGNKWSTAERARVSKNVTIKSLPHRPGLLHLVCPHEQPRYYLLLTGIHRFLAP